MNQLLGAGQGSQPHWRAKEQQMGKKGTAEETSRNIRRQTRRVYQAEEKICIVLEGLRGEETIPEYVIS
jgi:hypothetical protein